MREQIQRSNGEALEKANPIKDTPAMPQWNSDDGLMEWLEL